jgi:hypothetical protein
MESKNEGSLCSLPLPDPAEEGLLNKFPGDTYENHNVRDKSPTLGFHGIWKESVVALTTVEWSPKDLPSPLPPTVISSHCLTPLGEYLIGCPSGN